MATTKKFLDYTGLSYFYQKLKGIFVSKAKADEKYLEVGQESNAEGVVTATTIGFKSDALVSSTAASYSASTKLTTQGYVDEKVESVEAAVTSGLNITGTTEDGFLKIENKEINIDYSKLATATGESVGAETKLATEKLVEEKINETVTKAVVYKGATSTLPTGTPVNGDMWKLTAAIETPAAKAGDVIIYNGDTKAWEVIPSGDDVEFTGVKVGSTVVIQATEGGDVDFKVVGDLLTVSGAAGEVTYGATKKLTDAVAKVEGISATENGVTVGDVTYNGANVIGTETDSKDVNTIHGVKAYVDDKVGSIDAGVTAVTTSTVTGAISVNGAEVKIGGADDLANLISNGVTAATLDGASVIADNTIAFVSETTYEETDADSWTGNGTGALSLKIGGKDLAIAQRITDEDIEAICI